MKNLLLYIVFAEAIVNLIFNGTVLQPGREWIIKHTPFLVVRDEHPLGCKLCTSVWIGFFSSLLMMFNDSLLITVIVFGFVIHRCSNYLHAAIAILHDYRLDMLVKRRKTIERRL